MIITKEDDGRNGRYIARVDGIDAEARITFTHRGEGVISADHTDVPQSLNGRGIAKALLLYMLDDARNSGFRILPVCPFIRGQYKRHPEWSDLFTTEPDELP